jgi:ASC-1-like (ASCH) protein
MAKLHLNLKAEYFDQIKSGEKADEYRLCTPYWTRRLVGRVFDGIVLKKGYPKSGDASRTLDTYHPSAFRCQHCFGVCDQG